MTKNLLSYSLRAAVIAAVATGALTVQAQTEKLYLSDVNTDSINSGNLVLGQDSLSILP